MQTPTTVPTRTPMHPLMVVATIAIILLCGLSAAALLGWLPSSTGRNADAVPTGADQAAVAGAASSKAAPAQMDPPAAVARKAQPAPAVQKVAVATPAVCNSCA
jgi:hypothetical protein